MINSLEVGYEVLLQFFPLVSCISNKKRPADLNTSYLGKKLPRRSSIKQNMSLYDTICHEIHERNKKMDEYFDE